MTTGPQQFQIFFEIFSIYTHSKLLECVMLNGFIPERKTMGESVRFWQDSGASTILLELNWIVGQTKQTMGVNHLIKYSKYDIIK